MERVHLRSNRYAKNSSCLWFNDQAEQAAQFDASLFRDSKIGKTARYSEAAAKASGQKAP